MPKIGSLASNFEDPDALLEGFTNKELISELRRKKNCPNYWRFSRKLTANPPQIFKQFQRFVPICNAHLSTVTLTNSLINCQKSGR